MLITLAAKLVGSWVFWWRAIRSEKAENIREYSLSFSFSWSTVSHRLGVDFFITHSQRELTFLNSAFRCSFFSGVLTFLEGIPSEGLSIKASRISRKARLSWLFLSHFDNIAIRGNPSPGKVRGAAKLIPAYLNC